jgi:hypothetical protein
LRKSNEKIVTACKLALVMLGMQKKNQELAPRIPEKQDQILVKRSPMPFLHGVAESAPTLHEQPVTAIEQGQG